MFTEVGCDRYNSQSQESTAHQSMSIVKDRYRIKDGVLSSNTRSKYGQPALAFEHP